jgi:hypothetical protein
MMTEGQKDIEDHLREQVKVLRKRLDTVLWLKMEFAIHRYLMSNAEGREDGAEKAQRHDELCKIYVASVRLCTLPSVRHFHEEYYQEVHEKTQELTSYLTTALGFPETGRPDYDLLAPMFFEKFIKLADSADPTLFPPDEGY